MRAPSSPDEGPSRALLHHCRQVRVDSWQKGRLAATESRGTGRSESLSNLQSRIMTCHATVTVAVSLSLPHTSQDFMVQSPRSDREEDAITDS
jgi:hypothetical protein